MIRLPWTHKPPYGTKLDRQHPLAQGLVGCWLMNEDGGKILYDVVNNIPGGLSGNLSWQGNVLHFDGGDSDYVNCENPEALQITGPMTVLFDTVFDSNKVQKTGKHGAVDYGWLICKTAGGSLEYRISSDGSDWNGGTAGVSLDEGSKYNLAGVYDGAYMRAYVDGIEDTGGVFPLSYSSGINNTSADFYIGNVEGFGSAWLGSMFYYYVYNRGLTSVEIQALYANPYQIFEPMFIPSAAQSGLLPIECTFSSIVGISANLSGKIGTSGNIITSSENTAMYKYGQEGKQGQIESILTDLISLLSGNSGIDGDLHSIVSNSILYFPGKQGVSGGLSSQVSLSSQLFGSIDGGLPPIIFEGTLSGTAGALSSELFGNTGVGGTISSQIIMSASLAGKLGNTGSYTMNLPVISSLIEGVIGVSGGISTTISAGMDLAGKIGISGSIISDLESLDLQLFEIVRSDKIYQIIISTKTGQAVFLTPKTGKIIITTE